MTQSPIDARINFALNERRKQLQRYRSGHNEAVLKTVCPQGRVGSNPTLCVSQKNIEVIRAATSPLFSGEVIFCQRINILYAEVPKLAEGTPLERVQVVNSGARVQIPPSAFLTNNKNR